MPMPIQSALPTWDTTGRFLFPQERFTFYLSRVGDPILMPPKVPIELFLNPDATDPATDLRKVSDGAAYPANVVLIGDDGLVPQFYGAVGEKLYYGRPYGATQTYPVEAAYGPILDALYDAGYSTEVVHLPSLPRNDGTVLVWDAATGKPRLMAVLPIGNIPSLSSLYDLAGAATTAATAAQAAAIAAAATDATNKANGAASVSIPLTQRGASNGVATLDGAGRLPSAQLPPLAITDTFVVSSQSAMLALAAEVGDIAVRTDQSKTYILQTTGATVLSHWVELASSGLGQVISVDGQTGIVSLSTSYAPLTHASRHAAAGADPITPAAIGAETPAAAQTKATTAKNDAITSAAGLYLPLTQKGAASGLATLDSGSKVPLSQIPTLSAYDPAGAAMAAQAAAIDDATSKYVPLTQRAAAGGVATLDGSSKVPVGQVPSLPYDASGAASAAQAAAIAAASSDATTKANAAQSTAVSTAASAAAGLYIPLTQRAAASGVATLDSAGHVPAAQINSAPVLLLNIGDPVPGGTPAGTVIVRR